MLFSWFFFLPFLPALLAALLFVSLAGSIREMKSSEGEFFWPLGVFLALEEEEEREEEEREELEDLEREILRFFGVLESALFLLSVRTASNNNCCSFCLCH